MRKLNWLRMAVICLAPVALSSCSYLPDFGFGNASTPTAAPAATPEATPAASNDKMTMMMNECTAAGYLSGTVAYDLCVKSGTGLK